MKDEINKISISGMLEKRVIKKSDFSPNGKDNIQDNTNKGYTPKISISLDKNKDIGNIPKIKLSLNKDKNTKIDKNEDIGNVPKIKLSLNKAKNTQIDKIVEKKTTFKFNKTEIKEVNSNKIQEKNPSFNISNTVTENIISTKPQEKVIQDKITQKEVIQDKKIVSGKIKSIEVSKDDVGKEESIFNNYKSDFETESNFIISKLKKIKTLSRKKYLFIYGLLGISLITIIFLGFFSSKISNFSNYKTDIIGNKNNVISNSIEKLNLERGADNEEKKKKEKLEKIKNFLIDNKKYIYSTNYKQ